MPPALERLLFSAPILESSGKNSGHKGPVACYL